ncbi:MAG: 16S rRNA (guanine(527)-N(7))-methyltransferase RsmG, partial [Actinomycetota bacterium]|nr:16S rRNA (guanine(527)-N(7))-methyltransferase RsmG [Actinomycetota bacterium]
MSDSAEGVEAALATLATRYCLSVGQVERLARLLSLVEADPRAPTTVRSAERAVHAHVADSLAALELEVVCSAATIADLGTGAGFPGVVLALALERSEVALVESQTRKCAFLTDVLAHVGVANARVVCARAEEWREGVCRQDVVVARALAGQAVVLEYAAPLLRVGGTLLDWRGKRIGSEEDAAMRAAEELGLRRAEVRRMEPYEGSREHHLHVYLKV